MPPGELLRQPFVVPLPAPEASDPGNAALHYPAPWPSEAALGLRQVDDRQPGAVCGSLARGLVAVVALDGDRDLEMLLSGSLAVRPAGAHGERDAGV
jgi:hypothetical protein